MTISPSTSASTGSRLPSFIVIGAARSGTTALYRFLRQHPRIFMSRNKEPNFFAFEGQALDYRGPGADEASRAATDWFSQHLVHRRPGR